MRFVASDAVYACVEVVQELGGGTEEVARARIRGVRRKTDRQTYRQSGKQTHSHTDADSMTAVCWLSRVAQGAISPSLTRIVSIVSSCGAQVIDHHAIAEDFCSSG